MFQENSANKMSIFTKKHIRTTVLKSYKDPSSVKIHTDIYPMERNNSPFAMKMFLYSC